MQQWENIKELLRLDAAMREYKGVIAVRCNNDRIYRSYCGLMQRWQNIKELLRLDAAMTEYKGVIAVRCSNDRI